MEASIRLLPWGAEGSGRWEEGGLQAHPCWKLQLRLPDGQVHIGCGGGGLQQRDRSCLAELSCSEAEGWSMGPGGGAGCIWIPMTSTPPGQTSEFPLPPLPPAGPEHALGLNGAALHSWAHPPREQTLKQHRRAVFKTAGAPKGSSKLHLGVGTSPPSSPSSTPSPSPLSTPSPSPSCPTPLPLQPHYPPHWPPPAPPPVLLHRRQG